MALLLALVLLALCAVLRPFVLLLWRQHRSPPARPPRPALRVLAVRQPRGDARAGEQQPRRPLGRPLRPRLCLPRFLSGPRLMTTDPVAIAHILGHADDYPQARLCARHPRRHGRRSRRPSSSSRGDAHRRQVRGLPSPSATRCLTHPRSAQDPRTCLFIADPAAPLNQVQTPAFSAAHIRTLTPVFYDKATEVAYMRLVTILYSPRAAARHLARHTRRHRSFLGTSAPSTSSHGRGRATLDVIGLAGACFLLLLTHRSSPRRLRVRLQRADRRHERARARLLLRLRHRPPLPASSPILQAWFPILRRFVRPFPFSPFFPHPIPFASLIFPTPAPYSISISIHSLFLCLFPFPPRRSQAPIYTPRAHRRAHWPTYTGVL